MRTWKFISSMRIYFFVTLLLSAVLYHQAASQQVCATFEYQQTELRSSPVLQPAMDEIENFIKKKLSQRDSRDQQRGEHLFLITIPVVVHILYNDASQNISDQQVLNQLKLLTQCFRRQNSDSVNTPDRFKSLAADCDIEFKLAITDPGKRATSGIIRKYTPVTNWDSDDRVKSSPDGGDDAWDTKNYLNIWVCNLKRSLGFASFPGGDPKKDGIVLNFSAFGGKTLVHEAGHWLGLRHTWGDAICGDDFVQDTPKQTTFTSGCPSTIRASCGGEAAGAMYMNYMDITDGTCTNLFTEGQKERIRTLFSIGGARFSLLSSHALASPLISEMPVPEQQPQWFYANVYPNPATAGITIDLSYDIRWVGKVFTISTVQGQPAMQFRLSAKIMNIDINNLKPGVYFVTAKREDGLTIKQKLIKM